MWFCPSTEVNAAIEQPATRQARHAQDRIGENLAIARAVPISLLLLDEQA